MLDSTFILNYLKKHLSKKRYIHSINVSDVAEKLARYYGYDYNKAKLAGLVHDCAKDSSLTEQIYYAKNCGFPVDEVTFKVRELLHAPASVYICRKVFNILDMDILYSIRYHTTGKSDMSLLEKIIFIADIIEPNREFECVEAIRNLAYDDLDSALLCALDSSIVYVVGKKALLHPDTIYARNYLINSLH